MNFFQPTGEAFLKKPQASFMRRIHQRIHFIDEGDK